MSESPEQIRKHIDALSKFERDYREYIAALEADWSASVMAEAGHDEEGAGWSSEEWARRKRQLQMDAVRADRAIKVSGVGGLVFTEAPAAGGGVRSADLPSQIFDFIETGFGFTNDDGLSFQRKLLERMPSQIAGLEVLLEEAEAQPSRSKEKKPKPSRPPWRNRLGWLNHPWAVGIGCTVVGGGILAAVIALLH